MRNGNPCYSCHPSRGCKTKKCKKKKSNIKMEKLSLNQDRLLIEIPCVVHDRKLLDFHHNSFDAETMDDIADAIDRYHQGSCYGNGYGEHESMSVSDYDKKLFTLTRTYFSKSKLQEGKTWYVCLDCGHRFSEHGAHCSEGATCYCTRRYRGNTQPYPDMEDCEQEHARVEKEREQFQAMSPRDHIALYPGLQLFVTETS